MQCLLFFSAETNCVTRKNIAASVGTQKVTSCFSRADLMSRIVAEFAKTEKFNPHEDYSPYIPMVISLGLTSFVQVVPIFT